MERTLVEMAICKFYLNFKSGVFVACVGWLLAALLFWSVNGHGFLPHRTQLNLLSLWRPWMMYLSTCFGGFLRMWGSSPLLLTRHGLVGEKRTKMCYFTAFSLTALCTFTGLVFCNFLTVVSLKCCISLPINTKRSIYKNRFSADLKAAAWSKVLFLWYVQTAFLTELSKWELMEIRIADWILDVESW